MTRAVRAAVLSAGLVLAAGCGDDGKKSDPKPVGGKPPDPRLQPGGAAGETKPGAAAAKVVPKVN